MNNSNAFDPNKPAVSALTGAEAGAALGLYLEQPGVGMVHSHAPAAAQKAPTPAGNIDPTKGF